jgi:hypothetical protein
MPHLIAVHEVERLALLEAPIPGIARSGKVGELCQVQREKP